MSDSKKGTKPKTGRKKVKWQKVTLEELSPAPVNEGPKGRYETPVVLGVSNPRPQDLPPKRYWAEGNFVCTLALRVGMSLEEHLQTHPIEWVARALSEITLAKTAGKSNSDTTELENAPEPEPAPVTLLTAAKTNGQKKHGCFACGKRTHTVWMCVEFNKLSNEKRWEYLSSGNHCFNCLNRGHSTQKCPSNNRCQECGERHHTLLHEDN